MKHIKKFDALNERVHPEDFVNELSWSEIDVTDYDKTKYNGVDTAHAKISWEEDIDYSRGGITGIGAVVHRVYLIVYYELLDGETKSDEVEIKIPRENIEVESSDTMPYYANSLEVDLVKNTCVVKFGS